ncbi:FAD-dependent oxidoreductase, partial [bacterium]|nr:FAD-dependent oxidoreductase [bacterium]
MFRKLCAFIICLFLLSATQTPFAATAKMYDVVVYGGTAGGAIAAVAAAREGLDVALIESGKHIGGLTSGGLGRTDVGDSSVIGGYSREFYHRLGGHYGEEASWRFEPSIAEQTLIEMLKQIKVDIYYQKRLASVGKDGARITSIQTEDGAIFIADIFMDTTYEGDLMARVGVSYAWGREGREQYGESLAGRAEHSKYHQFDVDVSPYDDKGNVIPLVGTHDPGKVGGEDKMVQAYNLRLCFSDDPNN